MKQAEAISRNFSWNSTFKAYVLDARTCNSCCGKLSSNYRNTAFGVKLYINGRLISFESAGTLFRKGVAIGAKFRSADGTWCLVFDFNKIPTK